MNRNNLRNPSFICRRNSFCILKYIYFQRLERAMDAPVASTSKAKPEPKLPKKSAGANDVIKSLEDLKLENDVGDIEVMNAQQLVLQYFKSVYKQKMPDVVKNTVKKVGDYVQQKNQEETVAEGTNLDKFAHFLLNKANYI